MRRSRPLRRTPLDSRSQLRRTGGLERRTSLQQTGDGLTRTRMVAKPRRQPAHSPWPMTCPPGFRDAMIAAAGGRCGRCPATSGLTLSHRLAAGRGGPYTWWNLDVLCWPCHDHCERHPTQAEADGWRVPGKIVRGRYIGADGAFRRLVDRARAAL